MLKTMLETNTFVSLKILEALMQKNLSEEEKAKIIAEGFAELESRYPDLKHHATKDDVTKATLELTKEIELIRQETKEIETRLIKEIELIRQETKEIEAKLSREIKELDTKLNKEIKELDTKLSKEIKELDVKLTKEIKEVEAKLTKEIFESKNTTLKWTFIFWVTQMIALGGILYRLTQ
jgi:F0F1-type ATP synthase membrane subunit b/b'